VLMSTEPDTDARFYERARALVHDQRICADTEVASRGYSSIYSRSLVSLQDFLDTVSGGLSVPPNHKLHSTRVGAHKLMMHLVSPTLLTSGVAQTKESLVREVWAMTIGTSRHGCHGCTHRDISYGHSVCEKVTSISSSSTLENDRRPARYIAPCTDLIEASGLKLPLSFTNNYQHDCYVRQAMQSELVIVVSHVIFYNHPFFGLEDCLAAQLRLLYGEYRKRLESQSAHHLTIRLAVLLRTARRCLATPKQRCRSPFANLFRLNSANSYARVRSIHADFLNISVDSVNMLCDTTKIVAALYTTWRRLKYVRQDQGFVSTSAKLVVLNLKAGQGARMSLNMRSSISATTFDNAILAQCVEALPRLANCLDECVPSSSAYSSVQMLTERRMAPATERIHSPQCIGPNLIQELLCFCRKQLVTCTSNFVLKLYSTLRLTPKEVALPIDEVFRRRCVQQQCFCVSISFNRSVVALTPGRNIDWPEFVVPIEHGIRIRASDVSDNLELRLLQRCMRSSSNIALLHTYVSMRHFTTRLTANPTIMRFRFTGGSSASHGGTAQCTMNSNLAHTRTMLGTEPIVAASFKTSRYFSLKYQFDKFNIRGSLSEDNVCSGHHNLPHLTTSSGFCFSAEKGLKHQLAFPFQWKHQHHIAAVRFLLQLRDSPFVEEANICARAWKSGGCGDSCGKDLSYQNTRVSETAISSHFACTAKHNPYGCGQLAHVPVLEIGVRSNGHTLKGAFLHTNYVNRSTSDSMSESCVLAPVQGTNIQNSDSRIIDSHKALVQTRNACNSEYIMRGHKAFYLQKSKARMLFSCICKPTQRPSDPTTRLFRTTSESGDQQTRNRKQRRLRLPMTNSLVMPLKSRAFDIALNPGTWLPIVSGGETVFPTTHRRWMCYQRVRALLVCGRAGAIDAIYGRSVNTLDSKSSVTGRSQEQTRVLFFLSKIHGQAPDVSFPLSVHKTAMVRHLDFADFVHAVGYRSCKVLRPRVSKNRYPRMDYALIVHVVGGDIFRDSSSGNNPVQPLELSSPTTPNIVHASESFQSARSPTLNGTATYVSVSFQGNHCRTSLAMGILPLWKEIFELPCVVPSDFLSPTSQTRGSDSLHLCVFLVSGLSCKDLQTSTKLTRDKVHAQESCSRFLGDICVPWTTLSKVGGIEGIFEITMPISNLGHHGFGNELATPAIGDTHNIDSFPRWLEEDNGHPKLQRTGPPTLPQRSVAPSLYLAVTLQPAIPVASILPAMPMSSFEASSVVRTGTSWLREVRFYRHRVVDHGREFSTRKRTTTQEHATTFSPPAFALTSNGNLLLACRFLRPQRPPPGIDTYAKAARFVSMIPFGDAELLCRSPAGIVRLSTSQEFLDKGSGNWEEHAILLHNYLAWLQLHQASSVDSTTDDFFLVCGADVPYTRVAYVMQRPRTKLIQTESLTLWNPRTGASVPFADESCSRFRIDCMISRDNCYANMQLDKAVKHFSLDLSDPECWRPLFCVLPGSRQARAGVSRQLAASRLMGPPATFASVQARHLRYNPPSTSDANTIQMSLNESIKVFVFPC